MNIDILIKKIEARLNKQAFIFKDTTFLYKDLLMLINKWGAFLNDNKIKSGNVVALIGNSSPDAIALVIALISNKNIIVPLTLLAKQHFSDFFSISHTQFIIDLSNQNQTIIKNKTISPNKSKVLKSLIKKQHPGLILFTSGSAGKPKAVTHNFDKLLGKFLNANKKYRTLCFLMFDHIAGIDTYFYSLYSGGTIIIPEIRNPGYICKLIEKYKIEVLPTSPTFLNLLLLSEEYDNYDLSPLKIITFGSEYMPKKLLSRLEKVFKNVKLIQKYGMTELGSPPSKTKNEDSSWIKIDSDQFKIKIIDNILYVKTNTAMMGYLNAPSPFTEDGWFNTGDAVEVNGDYIKILGRKSDIINVGGEKVYPQEVENVILEMDNVAEATVYGENNPIIGDIVCAKVSLQKKEDKKVFVNRLKKYCRSKIQGYKVPVRIIIMNEQLYNDRFKKVRAIQK